MILTSAIGLATILLSAVALAMVLPLAKYMVISIAMTVFSATDIASADAYLIVRGLFGVHKHLWNQNLN